jgi:hypothetical protein
MTVQRGVRRRESHYSEGASCNSIPAFLASAANQVVASRSVSNSRSRTTSADLTLLLPKLVIKVVAKPPKNESTNC